MNNVNQYFNVFVDIPQTSKNLYVKIQTYKDNVFAYLYDSKNINVDYHYNYIIYNNEKEQWNKIPNNGIIDSNIYTKLSLINNQQNNNLKYRIQFYTDQITYDYIELIPTSNIYSYKDFSFNLHIPQLITTKNPILYWKKSNDIDLDNITYEIQLYQQEHLKYTFSNIEVDNNNDFVCFKITQSLNDNVLYKWRVRSKDSFKESSQWSDFYYFKIVTSLTFNIIIKKQFFQQLYNTINVEIDKQLLHYQIQVSNFVHEYLNYFVFVEVNKQLLYFNVTCKQTYYSDLDFVLDLTAFKQLLNFNIIVGNKFYDCLHKFIFVNTEKQLLNFKIDILKLLHFNIEVFNVIEEDINFELIIRLFYNLNFNIINQRRFSREEQEVINFNLFIKQKVIEPLIIKIYDLNNNQIKTDNRIQIYDQNGVNIIPYNKNGSVINVYPYDVNKPNNKILIYDKNNNLIEKIYDINGLQITVYDSYNLIKNWLPNQTYIAELTKYQYSQYYYKYVFDSTDSNILTNNTKNNRITLNASTSKVWKLTVGLYLQQKLQIPQLITQYIYTNQHPNACQPPFYIDGYLLDNNNNNNITLYNSMPTFSFNPITNNDNDLIKYHLKISDNQYFDNPNVDVYLNHSNTMITYKLNQNQLLNNKTTYYIYLATCDYYENEIKSQIPIENILSFNFDFNYQNLYLNLPIVYSDWKLLGFKAIICSYINQYYSLIVKKQFDFDLNFLLNIIIKLDLYYKINILSKQDLFFTLIANPFLNNLNFNLNVHQVYEENYIYYKLLIAYCTQSLTQNQQQLLGLNLRYLLKTVYLNFSDTPNNQIVVCSRLGNNFDFYNQCQVWNDIYRPNANQSQLKFSIAVSNLFYGDHLLGHKLTVVYPPPPRVIITSNIPQFQWQTQYIAQYYFNLEAQSSLPIIGYQYIFTKDNNITKWQNYKTTSFNFLRVDLRDVLTDTLSGKFYLHVRSVNNKQVQSVSITTYCIYYNNPINKPIPLQINGNLVVYNQNIIISYNNSINIYWTDVYDNMDLDFVTYDLQISSDILFRNIVFEQSNIIGNQYTLTPRQLAPSQYFFRIRAYDQNQYSQWSTIYSFYINKAPESPKNLFVRNIV